MGYKQILDKQGRDKRMRSQAEIDQDRLYAQLEVAQQEKTENVRRGFFDKMQGYQNANDAKTKGLIDFMQGRDLASLEKIDEERYIKALAEKEVNDRKNEELKNLNNRNTKNNNLAALQQQMNEKQ